MPRWLLCWDTPAGRMTRPIPAEGALVLGRDPTCDVVFADATVSRRHCEVFLRDGRAWLRHLSATNASYVNGRVALGETALSSGDLVALPVLAVTVVADDGPGADGDARPAPWVSGAGGAGA